MSSSIYMPYVNSDILEAALEGLVARRTKLDERIASVRAELNGGTTGATEQPKNAGRERRLSPEGRRRIAEAAKRRWAAIKKQRG